MKNALKWGLYISAVNIVLGLIMFIAGISNDTSLGWVRYIGSIIGLVLLFLGVKEKKAEDPASFTFGKGWVATFLICLVAAVVSAVWVFIYTTAIDPEMIEVTKVAQREAMMKAGTMTRAQVDQAMSYTSFFISPAGFAITMLLGYAFIGMILGLIISPIVRSMGGGTPPEETVVAS